MAITPIDVASRRVHASAGSKMTPDPEARLWDGGGISPVRYNWLAYLQMGLCIVGVAGILAASRELFTFNLGCIGLLEHTLFFGGALRRGYISHASLCTVENIALAILCLRLVHLFLNYDNLFSVWVTRVQARGGNPRIVLQKAISGITALTFASAALISICSFEIFADFEKFNLGLLKTFTLAIIQLCGISILIPEILLWIVIQQDLKRSRSKTLM